MRSLYSLVVLVGAVSSLGANCTTVECGRPGQYCGEKPGGLLARCTRDPEWADTTYGFLGRLGGNGCDGGFVCAAPPGEQNGVCSPLAGRCQPARPPYTNGYSASPSIHCPEGAVCEMRGAPPVGNNYAGTCIATPTPTSPIALKCDEPMPTSFLHAAGRAVDYTIEECDMVVRKPTTIAPGTVIAFGAARSIHIVDEGSLAANGSSTAHIVLKTKTSGSPWGGIQVFTKSAQNELSYVEILDSSAPRPEGTAAITVGQIAYPGGAVSIRDCFIDGGEGDGVFIGPDGSLRAFERNTIKRFKGYPVTVRADRVDSAAGAGNMLTGNNHDFVQVVHSEVPEPRDVKWAKLSVPYFVTGEANLTGVHTIAPGTSIVMGPDATIAVKAGLAAGGIGTLICDGTKDQRITIKGASATPGSWNSIWIQSNRANSIRSTDISGGSGIKNPFDARGMVALDIDAGGAAVSIRDCFLGSSTGYAVWANGETINDDVATANTFADNALGTVKK